jgi:hypothetical protein
VNLLGFLGVYGKIKDIKEAQQDQQRVKDPETGIQNCFKVAPATLLPKKRRSPFLNA